MRLVKILVLRGLRIKLSRMFKEILSHINRLSTPAAVFLLILRNPEPRSIIGLLAYAFSARSWENWMLNANAETPIDTKSS